MESGRLLYLLQPRPCSYLDPYLTAVPSSQVSFGVFETEEDAARQYDRALILEKVRRGRGWWTCCFWEPVSLAAMQGGSTRRCCATND